MVLGCKQFLASLNGRRRLGLRPLLGSVQDGSIFEKVMDALRYNAAQGSFNNSSACIDMLSDRQVLRKFGYTVALQLGDGAYAKVKLAMKTSDRANYAIKIVDKAKAPKDFLTKFLPRELEMIMKVRHRNIIQFYNYFEAGSRLFVVMGVAEQGDILNFIKNQGRAPENLARKWVRQIAQALLYLNNIGIVHRDLKCENILLDSNKNIKITDFGFARYSTNDFCTTYCGSVAYAAPEILQARPYDPRKSDIWALGVVMFIMVTGRMPFDDRGPTGVKKVLKVQLSGKLPFPNGVKLSAPCASLVQSLLQVDPEVRWSLFTVLHCEWMMMYDVDGLADQQARITVHRPNPPFAHHYTGGRCGLARPDFRFGQTENTPAGNDIVVDVM